MPASLIEAEALRGLSEVPVPSRQMLMEEVIDSAQTTPNTLMCRRAASIRQSHESHPVRAEMQSM